jgi:hypothetical protein
MIFYTNQHDYFLSNLPPEGRAACRQAGIPCPNEFVQAGM